MPVARRADIDNCKKRLLDLEKALKDLKFGRNEAAKQLGFDEPGMVERVADCLDDCATKERTLKAEAQSLAQNTELLEQILATIAIPGSEEAHKAMEKIDALLENDGKLAWFVARTSGSVLGHLDVVRSLGSKGVEELLKFEHDADEDSSAREELTKLVLKHARSGGSTVPSDSHIALDPDDGDSRTSLAAECAELKKQLKEQKKVASRDKEEAKELVIKERNTVKGLQLELDQQKDQIKGLTEKIELKNGEIDKAINELTAQRSNGDEEVKKIRDKLLALMAVHQIPDSQAYPDEAEREDDVGTDDEVEDNVAAVRSELDNANKTISGLKKDYEGLHDLFDQQEMENTMYFNDGQAAWNMVTALQDKTQELQKRSDQKDREALAASARLKREMERVEQAESEVRFCKTQRDNTQVMNRKLNQQIQAFETQRDNAQDMLQAAKESQRKLEIANKKLQEDLDASHTRFGDLEAKLSKELDDQREEQAVLETERQNLQDEKDLLQGRYSQLQQDRKALEDSCDQVRSDLDAARLDIRHRDGEVRASKEQQDKLERDEVTSRGRIQDLESQMRQLTMDKNALKRDKGRLEADQSTGRESLKSFFGSDHLVQSLTQHETVRAKELPVGFRPWKQLKPLPPKWAVDRMDVPLVVGIIKLLTRTGSPAQVLAIVLQLIEELTVAAEAPIGVYMEVLEKLTSRDEFATDAVPLVVATCHMVTVMTLRWPDNCRVAPDMIKNKLDGDNFVVWLLEGMRIGHNTLRQSCSDHVEALLFDPIAIVSQRHWPGVLAMNFETLELCFVHPITYVDFKIQVAGVPGVEGAFEFNHYFGDRSHEIVGWSLTQVAPM
ncbi:hypothetical protein ACHAQH_010057 [Verticillium albo-atrum]